MVAAAKMRRAQDAIGSGPAQQLDAVLGTEKVLILKRIHFCERPAERVALVVVTADRGLCGAFNGSICRRVPEQAERI